MECMICLEPFDERRRRPKVLPCGHTFCFSCLPSFHNKCPVDRRGFKQHFSKLPDNHQLLNVERSGVPISRRFWCRACGAEALESCLDQKHDLCSLRSRRREQASPLMQRLEAREAEIKSRVELSSIAADEKRRDVASSMLLAQLYQAESNSVQLLAGSAREQLAALEATRQALQQALNAANDEEWLGAQQRAEQAAAAGEREKAARQEPDTTKPGDAKPHRELNLSLLGTDETDEATRSRLLSQAKWRKIRKVSSLCCSGSPRFALDVLRRVGPNVEEVEGLRAARGEHLEELCRAPALRSLWLRGLDCSVEVQGVGRLAQPGHPAVPCLPTGLEVLQLSFPCRLELLSLRFLPRLRELSLEGWLPPLVPLLQADGRPDAATILFGPAGARAKLEKLTLDAQGGDEVRAEEAEAAAAAVIEAHASTLRELRLHWPLGEVLPGAGLTRALRLVLGRGLRCLVLGRCHAFDAGRQCTLQRQRLQQVLSQGKSSAVRVEIECGECDAENSMWTGVMNTLLERMPVEATSDSYNHETADKLNRASKIATAVAAGQHLQHQVQIANMTKEAEVLRKKVDEMKKREAIATTDNREKATKLDLALNLVTVRDGQLKVCEMQIKDMAKEAEELRKKVDEMKKRETIVNAGDRENKAFQRMLIGITGAHLKKCQESNADMTEEAEVLREQVNEMTKKAEEERRIKENLSRTTCDRLESARRKVHAWIGRTLISALLICIAGFIGFLIFHGLLSVCWVLALVFWTLRKFRSARMELFKAFLVTWPMDGGRSG